MFKVNTQEIVLNFSRRVAVIVRGLRNAFGMSQDDLSACAGIARPTLSKLEKLDVEGVRADTLEKLLKFFKEQGIEINFVDGLGVEIWIPEETLYLMTILVTENTRSRGRGRTEQSQSEVVVGQNRYPRKEGESMLDYVRRIKSLLDEKP